MNRVIVYTSNAGHTREYAQLLGERTGLPVFEKKQQGRDVPADAEVIFMGWLMAGQVMGYKEAAKQWKICAVCGVGMARPGLQVADIQKVNKVPEETKIFSLQGGFEMEKLHGIYKMMMRTMSNTVGKKLTAKPDRTEEEEEILRLMRDGGNMVCLEGLEPVLEWLGNI